MGSGGLFVDYDGDGWIDIFLVDGGGRINKAAAPVVAVARHEGIVALRQPLERSAVDDGNVKIAVVVVVEQRRAVAVGLDDE